MIADDPRSRMLLEVGECAFRLGKVFGARAERATTAALELEYFELFERCAFALRMSVALELRLRREARAEVRDARFAERDAPEHDPAERNRSEHDPIEREAFVETEAEREREPASLPILLKSLEGVAAGASALPGPEPAELPTLRELLARVKSAAAPDPGPGSRPKPPAGGGLKARLAASATAPAFDLASATSPHPMGRLGALPRRRATGPPR
ncbi:hypothetical protein [Phenylobacterium sp.]|uniref:hypothetical protein n=1 Tax=Phenylobacterium sp. TaxID=1871053 RepID=UPI0025F565D6|nr:hypothetical protein [Phenylobacterium sp.]